MVEYPSPFLKQRAVGNSEVKRGDAILISMEKNSGEGKDRPGAGVDRGRLETLFGTLCFNVHNVLDQTAENLKERLKRVADHTEPDETSDSFVLFVSAHGNTDNQGHYIIASDGQQVYIYEDIIKVLTNSDKLKGIPKVFFINACRGDSKSPIRPTENVVEYMKSAKDTLVIFSTDEGNESMRDTQHGTFFVQTLNDVIIHNHDIADVYTMAQMANKRLIEKTEKIMTSKKKPKCQVQNIHINMTGNLFWRTRHPTESSPDLGNVIVGQDHQREKLRNWLLSRESKATGSECFVISGMGGIGKTTLTKSMFEDENIKYYYDHRVYWVTIKKDPDILKCQRRLISEICKETPSTTLNSQKLLLDELKTKLSTMRRIFLVLDDVWETTDVDSLLGHPFLSTLPRGSKCIITSRKPAELQKLHASIQVENLDVLNDADAKKLFLCKAFRRETVPELLSSLVEEVIDACGNMPILLATIGADQWIKTPSIASLTEVRDRLKTINEDSEIYQKLFKQLKISYDDLPVRDSIDFKDFFQDFAAFPDSEEIEISVLMDLWTKPGLTEDEAYKILEELEQRCLLKIDGYWCHVHDIFRALAVELAQESPVSKRKRLFAWGLLSRLPEAWEHVDSFETEKMVIAKSELKEFHPNDAILFQRLPQLRMLFLTSNLNLVSLPPAIGCMRSLAKLDLSWCLGLKQLPQEIGQLESLEKLNMAGCCSLAALPPSIGNLKRLIELNMQSCGIKNLPDEIGELTNLTYLCLNDCDKLQQLPDAMGKLSSLEKLDCELLEIKEIPSTLGNLSSLKHLSFAACGSITEIPAELANLEGLISCCFTSCHRLNKIPHELDNLRNQTNQTKSRNEPEVGVEMRGVLVNPSQVFHPSDKEERRASFGLARIISMVKTEPFLSQRFDMGIRLMYTMANHDGTRHAIVRSGGLPVLLRCIDKGKFERCGCHAAATLRNICVANSTHKAVVDAGALSILTRVLNRKNHIRFYAYQALTLIRNGDVEECDYTFTTLINELCGHSYVPSLELDGCCIYCKVEREFFRSGIKTKLKS